MSPIFTLEAGSYVVLEFDVPKCTRFEYKVESVHPVSIYLVDDDGLRAYEGTQGKDFEFYEGSENRKKHHNSIYLQLATYYLIIGNRGSQDTPVYYEMYY